MPEQNMPQFRRQPAIKMLIAEVKEITHELPINSNDRFESHHYLSPTGEVVSKVMVVGTALEKEDVGTDQPFWKMRIADPTGGTTVFAGQYQAESAQKIAMLEIPAFVAVTGKISIYEPENGQKIVSIRPDNIVQIGIKDYNFFLIDAAKQLAERMKQPKNAEKVKEIYPNWDPAAISRTAIQMLHDILEQEIGPQNNTSTPEEPPAVADTEPQKTAEKKKEKEKPKKEEKPPVLDLKEFVIKTIKEKGPKGCKYKEIMDAIKAQGITMVDLEGTISTLMKEGEVYEPKTGVLMAA